MANKKTTVGYTVELLLRERVYTQLKHYNTPGFYPTLSRDTYYPLVICYIAKENHHFEWDNSLEMAMFNSYFDITKG